MGIPITIIEEVIARACKREAEGSIEENLNSQTSPWKAIVNKSLFNGKKKGKYCDMQK